MRELKEIIQFVQRQIGTKDDGIVGFKTISRLNSNIRLVLKIKKHWSWKRKMIAFIQFLAIAQGIEAGKIDGYFGPQTQYAFEQLIFLEKYGKSPKYWRSDAVAQPTSTSANPHGFPGYDQIVDFYGQPGTNLITIPAPYPLKLAWDITTTVQKITCHKKVSKSLTGVLEALKDHYGIDQLQDLRLDLYGGCFNRRKMRGGSKPSTHSWGVAIDLDPGRNRLKWNHTQAHFARPEYQFLLEAFSKEGWISLGQAKDYDWMHFQAVRL